MARPKRKSAAIAESPPHSGSDTAEDLQDGDYKEPTTTTTTTKTTPTTTTPSGPRRRSSRRAASSQHREAPPKEGAGLTPNNGESPASQAESGKMSIMAAESVGDVIRGLEGLEQSLKRAVKRQKFQIEQSRLLLGPEARERKGWGPPDVLPERLHKRKEVLNDDVETIKLPTRDSQTQELDVKQEQELEEGEAGAIESTENSEVAERGPGRPPAVNSNYLPLPWKGRLGYACLNTYLRTANPPIFCSRTCRMSSIIDHRHPLRDPSQPEHPTKNSVDKTQPGDVARGRKWVQQIGLTNAGDIVKMLRWNDRYAIKFMRLSSEMFPFASHPEHGYKLAPFASEVLEQTGKVAAELGHRLTTHPGQFTQLGSPRKGVIQAAVRDLEYHDELLTLLKLPPQQDRDAVMVIHMGGTYGDKTATLDRFRENYTSLLSDSIKRRLVLENDDVAWSVHDLLPVCEELDIPLVLDYHHHNIIFDESQVREGTLDISQPEITARIKATWTRKGITQKMHYSEPCAGATTPRDRRKHSPRVATLPPCPPDADLMIEAKDKEQAVFELMRNFRLPGHELIHDIVPYERLDENRPAPREKKAAAAKAGKGKRKSGKPEPENEAGLEDSSITTGGAGVSGEAAAEGIEGTNAAGQLTVNSLGAIAVSPENVSMGGPLSRVYWPLGMEEWLKPKKRERKSKAPQVDTTDEL